MNVPIELKDAIRQARIACNLTQKELAARLNVSTSAVAQWEVGNNNPSLDKIIDICTVLGISASSVFGPGRPYEGLFVQTGDEFELITLWRKVKSETDRDFFVSFLKRLVFIGDNPKIF